MAQTTAGRVAVIGTGVIGASWTSWFLGRGLDVQAWDPAPGAEAALRQAVAGHWQALMPARDASPDRLSFHATPEAAVAGCDFVQENGPERLEVKRALFRRLDAASDRDALLVSSSSTLMASEFQEGCAEPGRILLGHPFNPPHLIPLVEVVGGRLTDDAAIARAMAFYAAVGKHPIRLRREMRGHVSNRLQAALWRELFYLLREGVADVADLDAAIAHGPGLRWALLGPFFNLHLSGGPGGMRHTLDHLGPAIEAMWRDLGTVQLDAATREAVLQGTAEALDKCDVAETVRRRDEVLIRLVQMKAAAGLP